MTTQSQESPQQSNKKASLSHETQSQHLESAPFTMPLQLSVNTESSSLAQQTSKQIEEDSQATQIEELEEPPGVDTSDSAISHCDQRCESNGVSSEAQTASSSKASISAESPKHRSECAKVEQSNLSQMSDLHKNTTLNLENVNVKDSKTVSKDVSSADMVSCSQTKFDSPDLTVNSCVQETPSDTTPCSLASQSVVSQTSAVNVVKSSVDAREEGTSGKQTGESLSQQCGKVGNTQTDKDMVDECEQGVVEEEEVVMEEAEVESAGRGGASGIALVLSQSQLLSPEPMEEESEDQEEDSVIVVSDSERESQIPQKDVTPQLKTDNAQPVGGKVSASTNGHESQPHVKEVTGDRLSQAEKTVPEPEMLKDKSLSDSSGGKLGADVLYLTVSQLSHQIFAQIIQ